MSDQVIIRDSSGTPVPIASDDTTAGQVQYVKLDLGGNGANAPAEGTVPVSGTVTATVTFPATQPVSGSVDISASTQFTTRIDPDANGNPVYIGQAAVGTATSAASWRIRKCVFDGNNNMIAVLWPGDALYDNVWDNRALLTYS